MTDTEIKKALECCSMSSYPACRDCPYHDDYVNRDCINKRNADIKDLINRLQAENERLKEVNDSFTDIGKLYSEIKAEAYKEFAEKLKEKLVYEHFFETEVVFLDKIKIDKVLKELVGE